MFLSSLVSLQLLLKVCESDVTPPPTHIEFPTFLFEHFKLFELILHEKLEQLKQY
jgi:hypothetical protein